MNSLAERAQFRTDEEETDEETTTTDPNAQPKLEQMTLPPPPKVDDGPANPQPKVETVTPRIETPPPPPATRPREADPAKKKGKKGDDEP